MTDFLKCYGDCTGPFGTPMFEDDARKLDQLLKESTDDICPFRKEVPNSFEHFVENEKADVSVLTDDSVDLDKEVVDINSIDWSPLRKSNVVPFAHNYNVPPVGRSLWQKKVGNRWKAKTEYLVKRPENYPKDKEWFPESVWHMIKSGFLPGKSIGGYAKKETITKEDLEKNPHWTGAKTIRRNSVVTEYSVVTKNCNTNAVVEAVAKNVFSLEDEIVHEFFPEIAEKVIAIKKQINPEMPLIKSYTTAETYQKELSSSLEAQLKQVMNSTPIIVGEVIDRLLGKV